VNWQFLEFQDRLVLLAHQEHAESEAAPHRLAFLAPARGAAPQGAVDRRRSGTSGDRSPAGTSPSGPSVTIMLRRRHSKITPGALGGGTRSTRPCFDRNPVVLAGAGQDFQEASGPIVKSGDPRKPGRCTCRGHGRVVLRPASRRVIASASRFSRPAMAACRCSRRTGLGSPRNSGRRPSSKHCCRATSHESTAEETDAVESPAGPVARSCPVACPARSHAPQSHSSSHSSPRGRCRSDASSLRPGGVRSPRSIVLPDTVHPESIGHRFLFSAVTARSAGEGSWRTRSLWFLLSAPWVSANFVSPARKPRRSGVQKFIFRGQTTFHWARSSGRENEFLNTRPFPLRSRAAAPVPVATRTVGRQLVQFRVMRAPDAVTLTAPEGCRVVADIRPSPRGAGTWPSLPRRLPQSVVTYRTTSRCRNSSNSCGSLNAPVLSRAEDLHVVATAEDAQDVRSIADNRAFAVAAGRSYTWGC